MAQLRLCAIPVSLTLHNGGSAPASLRLSLESGKGGLGWVGPAASTLRLPPGGSLNLALTAVLGAPGLHQLAAAVALRLEPPGTALPIPPAFVTVLSDK